MKQSPHSKAKTNETIDQKLAPIIKEILFPFFDNKTLVMFTSSCKTNASSYKGEVNKRAGNALLEAVVKGDEDKARKIIQQIPELLCYKDSCAVDYSGRLRKDVTPFQAALCDGDVNMCEMMKEVGFSQLENGQDKLKKQFDEIFPHGIDEHIKEQEKNVFDFGAILKAIKNSSDAEVKKALNKNFDNNLTLHKALTSSRKEFHQKSISEKIFNPFHLQKALEIYCREFNNLGTVDKQYLFWRQVIGYTQRYLSACYAQAFAQGFYYIVQANESPLRSFKSRLSDKSLYPLCDSSGLGFDFAAVLLMGGVSTGTLHGPRAALLCYMISDKSIRLSELTRPQQKTRRSCVIQ